MKKVHLDQGDLKLIARALRVYTTCLPDYDRCYINSLIEYIEDHLDEDEEEDDESDTE